jgi:phosphotransferase system HPr (HPr) family protein
MQEVILTVRNKVGLHARPAALFVRTANKFKANIKVENLSRGSSPVNAKSILSLLTVAVECNHRIQVTAEGKDEVEAITALKELVNSNFGEG